MKRGNQAGRETLMEGQGERGRVRDLGGVSNVCMDEKRDEWRNTPGVKDRDRVRERMKMTGT